MSTVRTNNVQVGQSVTATNNFTLYQPSSPDGTVRLGVGNSGATTLDVIAANNSGNVGIGTSSPQGKLDVNGIINVAAGSGVGVRLGLGTAFAAGQAEVYGQGSIPLGIGTAGAQPLNLYTNSTLAARIDSNGNLLVGATSFSGGVPNDSAIVIRQDGYMVTRVSANGNYAAEFQNVSGTGVGNITVNSGSTQYITSSDYRLKEDITPMTGALATVAALKPVSYKWKATGEATQGFIAHELQVVIPECVVGEKDAVDADGKPVYQGIDTSFLVATLTAAIQELSAKVDAQAAEIAALKGAA